ncbi:hypothetical protein C1S80_13230 [Mycolicibacterium aubagnense]|nr:hypothetical protein C1S80_13230 [Mycolicibacterium aubagnense]
MRAGRRIGVPAANILGCNGFDIERTPEDWLFKAHQGVVVGVLRRINGVPVDFRRCPPVQSGCLFLTR